MNRFHIFVLALLMISLFAGCEEVGSTFPMGEKAMLLNPEDWDGTWICSSQVNEGPLTVKVIDSKKGILRFAGVSTAHEKFALSVFKLHIRKSGDWHFCSFTDDAADQADAGYIWGRIKKSQDQLIVWLPDTLKFRSLVKRKILPGHMERDNVILEKLTPEHYKLITSDEEGILLEWEDPLVFNRVTKK